MNVERRFAVAYAMVFFFALNVVLTVVVVLTTLHGHTRSAASPVACKPLTSKTYPDAIACHFGKTPYAPFDGQSYGVRDGWCKAWTNEVSWLVIRCEGSVETP